VDGDYALHVFCVGIVVLSLHGVEEHLLRGIDPVPALVFA
jgi:hypothetical protein